MTFSRRFPEHLEPTALYRYFLQKSSTEKICDLTVGNPTMVDLQYPRLSTLLAGEILPAYHASAGGHLSSRQRLLQHELSQQARLEGHLSVEDIFLTSSTSEAYQGLFKLLADPGDVIALPRPCYPLLQHLVELEGLRAVFYDLFYDGISWELDLLSVESLCQQGCKIFIVIQPHHPTGMSLDGGYWQCLQNWAKRYQLTFIVDEVFRHYQPISYSEQDHLEHWLAMPLLFRLQGLSKHAALPGVKLAWLLIHGQARLRQEAAIRLSWILDATLSLSQPIEERLAEMLAMAPVMQQQILLRIEQNRTIMQQSFKVLASHLPIHLLPWQGGWYGLLRCGSCLQEDSIVYTLLKAHNLWLHPGYFYDFQNTSWLVFSWLCTSSNMLYGVQALMDGFSVAKMENIDKATLLFNA